MSCTGVLSTSRSCSLGISFEDSVRRACDRRIHKRSLQHLSRADLLTPGKRQPWDGSKRHSGSTPPALHIISATMADTGATTSLRIRDWDAAAKLAGILALVAGGVWSVWVYHQAAKQQAVSALMESQKTFSAKRLELYEKLAILTSAVAQADSPQPVRRAKRQEWTDCQRPAGAGSPGQSVCRASGLLFVPGQPALRQGQLGFVFQKCGTRMPDVDRRILESKPSPRARLRYASMRFDMRAVPPRPHATMEPLTNERPSKRGRDFG